MTRWKAILVWTFCLTTTTLTSNQQNPIRESLQELPAGNITNPKPCKCKSSISECPVVHNLSDYFLKYKALCPKGSKICCEGVEEMDFVNSDLDDDQEFEKEVTALYLENIEKTSDGYSRQIESKTDEPRSHSIDDGFIPVSNSSRDVETIEKSIIQLFSAWKKTRMENILEYYKVFTEDEIREFSIHTQTVGGGRISSERSGDKKILTQYEKKTQLFETDSVSGLAKCEEGSDRNSIIDKEEMIPGQKLMSMEKENYIASGVDEETDADFDIIHESLIDFNFTFTLDKLLEMCALENDLDHKMLPNLDNFTDFMYNLIGSEQVSFKKIDFESTKAMTDINFGDAERNNRTVNEARVGTEGNTMTNFCAMLNYFHANVLSPASDSIALDRWNLMTPENRYQPIQLEDIEVYKDVLHEQIRSPEAPQKGIGLKIFYWLYVTAFLYVACYLSGFVVTQFSVPGLVMKIILVQYFPEIINFPVFQVVDLAWSSLYSLET